MKARNESIMIVLLLVAVVLQATIFNRYTLFTVHFQFAWIAFILAIPQLPNDKIPLIGTGLGWLLGVLSAGSVLTTTLIGFIIGLAGKLTSNRVVFSLTWVRVVLVSLLIVLLELPYILPENLLINTKHLVVTLVVSVIGIAVIDQLILRFEYEK